jgi:hypothetical protein
MEEIDRLDDAPQKNHVKDLVSIKGIYIVL